MSANVTACLLFLLILSDFAAVARADDPFPPRTEEETLREARIAVSSGNAEESLRLLNSLDREKVRDRRTFDFVRGLALMELGRPKEAVYAFRSVVNREPGLLRPRLELARAYFASGDNANAKRQFNFVLAADIPPAVRANIGRFLRRIQDRRPWRVDFALGVTEDSNINESTSAQTVVIAGLPFRLNDTARETAGRGLSVFLGGSYLPRLPGGALDLSAGLWVREYEGDSFDEYTLELFAGYRKRLGRGEIAIGPVVLRSWLGGRRYENSWGGRVEAVLLPSPLWRLSAVAETLEHEFPGNFLHDGRSMNFRLALRRLLGIRTSATVFAGRGSRRTERDHLDYDEVSLGHGLYREMPLGFTVSLRADALRRLYKARELLFAKTRREWTGHFSASVANRLLSYRGFYPRMTVIHTRRNSSVNFYDYTRTRFVFDITRRF